MENSEKVSKKPYKFDSEKMKLWLESYKKTGSVVGACAATKVSRHIVYYYIQRNNKFREQKICIDNQIDDAVEAKLHKLCDKNTIACIFWLCNRRPEKWKNVQQIDHKGDVGLKLVIEDAKYDVVQPESK